MSEKAVLTMGEERFIEESTAGWGMSVREALLKYTEIPDSVQEMLMKLEASYVENFRAFYTEAKKKEGDAINAAKVQYDFDEKWNGVHPEFFDFDKLLSDCK